MTVTTNLPAGTVLTIKALGSCEYTTDGRHGVNHYSKTPWIGLTTGGSVDADQVATIVSVPNTVNTAEVGGESVTTDESLAKLRFNFNQAFVALAEAQDVGVEFDYKDAKGNETYRYVDAVELTHHGLLLGGQDEDAGEYRNFRIDRINGIVSGDLW